MYIIIGYKLNNGFGYTELPEPIEVESITKIEEFERATERKLGGGVTVDAAYRTKFINKRSE